jgi:hypothetical protein
MMWFFEWLGSIPWWIRLSIGLICIAISTLLFFFAHRLWPWGWAVGFVMLVFGGPSDSEKKGYRF